MQDTIAEEKRDENRQQTQYQQRINERPIILFEETL